MALKILGSGYTSKITARGWNDNINWPTTPADEIATRDRLQSQHDQTIDYMNDFLNYYSDTGAANALVITPDPVFTTYNENMAFYVKVANACTGACTINVNGLGTKSLKKYGGVDLVSGDISAGQIIHLKYDGTNFQMLSEAFANSNGNHIGANDACNASGNVNLVAFAEAIIDLTSESFDSNLMHDSSTNPSRITIKTPGIYQIGAYASCTSSQAGQKSVVSILLNGITLVIGSEIPITGINISLNTVIKLSENDYLQVRVNNRTNENMTGTANLYTVRIA